MQKILEGEIEKQEAEEEANNTMNSNFKKKNSLKKGSCLKRELLSTIYSKKSMNEWVSN